MVSKRHMHVFKLSPATDTRSSAAPREKRKLFRQRSVRSLLRNDDGGMAVVYALSLVPLLGFAGVALDYSRASLAQARLQAALDAAGLSVGQLPPKTPIEEVEQKALDWMKIAIKDKGLEDLKLVATKDSESIHLTADSSLGVTLSKVLTSKPFKISANTEISWAKDKFEIVLVLDNSSSMEMLPDGSTEPDPTKTKLADLKRAATSLIDYLDKRLPEKGQLKISVVPFSGTVKVGQEYKDAPWIDRNGLSPINKEIFNGVNVKRFELLAKMGLKWAGCVEGRPMKSGGVTVDYDISETPPDPENPGTLFVPYFYPDEPDQEWADEKYGYRTKLVYNSYIDDFTTSSDWNDHQGNVDKYYLATVPKASSTWGPNRGCKVSPILRLTPEMEDVKKRISDMVIDGGTNINMGLMWGWHALSPMAPFADGATYSTPTLHKIVILMTDGRNNYDTVPNPNNSAYFGFGYWGQGRIGGSRDESDSTRTSRMNERMSLLCTTMKKKKIKIYTMRVEFGTGIDELLQSCATTPDMYYDVKDSANLEEVFEDIGKKITQLRVSK